MTADSLHSTYDGGTWCLYRSDAPVLTIESGVLPPQRDDDGWILRLAAGVRCSLSLPPSAHWFGQRSFARHGFPLDRLNFPPSLIETWDNGPAGHACIQEPLWLASNGLMVIHSCFRT